MVLQSRVDWRSWNFVLKPNDDQASLSTQAFLHTCRPGKGEFHSIRTYWCAVSLRCGISDQGAQQSRPEQTGTSSLLQNPEVGRNEKKVRFVCLERSTAYYIRIEIWPIWPSNPPFP